MSMKSARGIESPKEIDGIMLSTALEYGMVMNLSPLGFTQAVVVHVQMA